MHAKGLAKMQKRASARKIERIGKVQRDGRREQISGRKDAFSPGGGSTGRGAERQHERAGVTDRLTMQSRTAVARRLSFTHERFRAHARRPRPHLWLAASATTVGALPSFVSRRRLICLVDLSDAAVQPWLQLGSSGGTS